MSAPTIIPLDCGWLRQQIRAFVPGGSHDEFEIPVPSWLVRHRLGDVVFDVGLHPSLADGPEPLGGLARIFTPILEPGGTIAPRLREHDVDPDASLTVVLSHCHFDHVGGLCELPNARVLVDGAEWDAGLGRGPGGGSGGGYLVDWIDLGHDVVRVAGGHDLFGDGTVTIFPTPGHTCGHQSLRVETANGPVILAADACYFSHTLDDGVLPPFSFDFDQQRASLELLRRERSSGTSIVPGHDATVFQELLTDQP